MSLFGRRKPKVRQHDFEVLKEMDSPTMNVKFVKCKICQGNFTLIDNNLLCPRSEKQLSIEEIELLSKHNEKLRGR